MSASDKLPFRKRHPWFVRIAAALLVLALGFSAYIAVAVRNRLEQERLGLATIEAPAAATPIEGSSKRSGAFTAEIEFTSMAATEGQRVAAEVSWDDDWFFQDPTAYNHELATTCSVLSAVANAESSYYQEGSDAPAYMENALGALGFEEISTASYQYRSEVFDEVIDFFAGTDDVVAYSVATKHVTSSTGEEKVLYLVSIRGSYGAEWLSDFNMGNAADYDMDAIDHEGFMRAADEIIEDLSTRLTEEYSENPDVQVALLFTGHSRGAATANLAASYADDMASGLRPLTTLENIYCYTFATPEVTQFDNTGEALYNNIFNIMNPSDLVPRLPLASWGYARYGRDLWLPGYGDATFNDHYADMQAAFEENVGAECPYVPEDRAQVDAFIEKLGEQIPTQDDLVSAGGIASLIQDFAVGLDPVRVLYGHYPGVYIAWMQVIDADDLRSS